MNHSPGVDNGGDRSAELILASGSARRRSMLEQAGFRFRVHPADIAERWLPDEPPDAAVQRLAREKAEAVAAHYPAAVVIGADTLVCLDRVALGKPADMEQAGAMIRALSGRTHHVFTGVALVRSQPACAVQWHACTEVTFRSLDDDAVAHYLAVASPLDKAGAYAIQDHEELLVDHYRGGYDTVVGLPVAQVVTRLAELGVVPAGS